MTSFAFILGVLPLVISSGSGSEMRQAVGVAVFFGMLGVTLFGLIFTPIFYVIVRNLADGQAPAKSRRAANMSLPRPILLAVCETDGRPQGY